MAAISYQYYYHAVGQGLFCSGQLHRSDSPNEKSFSWIVDCGTVSERTFLQREMRLFREALKGQPIHLACLSHFDEDHVNGAAQLLSNHRIDSLVLPFVPLVERLLIAVATPNISKEFLQFLIDPAGYLFGVAGQNLGAVYFVSSASSDGENEGGSGKRRPSDGLDLRPPHKLQIPPDPEDTRGSSDPDSNPPIYVVSHDDPFAVSNLWEFMFYNEHKTHYKLEALREAVVKALKMYGKPNKAFRGPELLAELSEIYSASLGDSSAARNRISLITYTGPILQSHQKASHPSSGMELPVDGFAYGTPI